MYSTPNIKRPSCYKDYDVLVYMGRFSPFHRGHEKTVEYGLRNAKKLIVIVGSAKCARTPKNPWTADERLAMIRAWWYAHMNNVEFIPKKLILEVVEDAPYDDQLWLSRIQRIVAQNTDSNDKKIGILGCKKDSSSFYLDMFPQWEKELIPLFVDQGFDSTGTISATTVRNILFDDDPYLWNQKVANLIPRSVFNWIEYWKKEEPKNFEILRIEHRYYRDYDKFKYESAFLTADSVVVQSGHILVIKRKKNPGMDLYALPGGFVGSQETFSQAAVRELREETKLKVSDNTLKLAFKEAKTFANPGRSLRGRVLTVAHLFKLNDDFELPEVKGHDDAKEAFWMPLTEVHDNRHMFFEDHYHIINAMVNKV